jgi:quinoprotein glucose dehydrogenase
MFAKLIGLVVGLLGIGLLGLGVWLAALGGSVAYAALGLGMLVTAWYIMRGEELALTIYAALMVLALGWAVWEVGFDWWQLGPRGGLIVIIGLLLWLPAVRLGLRSPTGKPGSWVTIGAANVLCIGLSVFSMFQKPHEIDGSLSAAAVTPRANLGGNVPPEDWHQYGRTANGHRYSPLDQITPANVAGLVPAWHYQTGDVKLPEDIGETTYQVTPIKVGNTLYICTPHDIAIALDAATGAEKWRFDANSGLEPDRQHQTCRG